MLLGLPGAGKGTQAARLAEVLGVPHVATGDMFREAMAAGTPVGLQVKAVVEAGAYVPDGLTIALVEERLRQPDCAPGFVLDGFPRTVGQAEALDRLLGRAAARLDRVLLLDVPEAVVLARLTGRRTCPACGATYHMASAPPGPGGACLRCGATVVQRADDREDVQRRRLETYRTLTEPLVPFYAAAGRLVRVSGEGAVDAVAARLRAAAVGA